MRYAIFFELESKRVDLLVLGLDDLAQDCQFVLMLGVGGVDVALERRQNVVELGSDVLGSGLAHA